MAMRSDPPTYATKMDCLGPKVFHIGVSIVNDSGGMHHDLCAPFLRRRRSLWDDLSTYGNRP